MRKLPIFWHFVLAAHLIVIIAAGVTLYEKSKVYSCTLHTLRQVIAQQDQECSKLHREIELLNDKLNTNGKSGRSK